MKTANRGEKLWKKRKKLDKNNFGHGIFVRFTATVRLLLLLLLLFPSSASTFADTFLISLWMRTMCEPTIFCFIQIVKQTDLRFHFTAAAVNTVIIIRKCK